MYVRIHEYKLCMVCVRTYVCTCVFVFVYVCVCVCARARVLSLVSKLDTDHFGVLVKL